MIWDTINGIHNELNSMTYEKIHNTHQCMEIWIANGTRTIMPELKGAFFLFHFNVLNGIVNPSANSLEIIRKCFRFTNYCFFSMDTIDQMNI